MVPKWQTGTTPLESGSDGSSEAPQEVSHAHQVCAKCQALYKAEGGRDKEKRAALHLWKPVVGGHMKQWLWNITPEAQNSHHLSTRGWLYSVDAPNTASHFLKISYSKPQSFFQQSQSTVSEEVWEIGQPFDLGYHFPFAFPLSSANMGKYLENKLEKFPEYTNVCTFHEQLIFSTGASLFHPCRLIDRQTDKQTGNKVET